MAKYVKCIQSDFGTFLTEGNCYKIINSDSNGYLVYADNNEAIWYRKYRFGEPYELPEPITFASQEEFENAVMEVVLKRLGVYNYTESPTGGGFKDYIYTEDLG